MSYSCGIFFADVPRVYTLTKKVGNHPDRDSTGVLARGEPVDDDVPAVDEDEVSASAETGEYSPKYDGGYVDRIDVVGGPGLPLETLFPGDPSWPRN